MIVNKIYMTQQTKTIFAIIAIVAAVSLITVSVVGQDVTAYKNKKISQHIHQHQESHISTAGANSGITNSGNNAATATNTNNGGIS